MKKLLLSLVFLAIMGLSNVFAQEKVTVGILPATYVTGSANLSDVNSIQEEISSCFVKTKRFNIVDRSKMDALKSEKELQKSEDYIDGSVVAQGASLGAQYLISCNVNSATAIQVTTKDPKTGQTTISGYKEKLSIALKVIDVSTGKVIATETIEPKGGTTLGALAGTAPQTPEKAFSKALQDIQNKIDDFVAKNFPLTFSISEITEKDAKGNAVTIQIAGGSEYGLQKGQKLKVVEITEKEVDGKKIPYKKEVGEIKVTKVEDENFSTCTVIDGGADINAKFEAKVKLKVITKND